MTQAANLAALGTNVDTAGDVSLTTGVAGTLPVANGGTGTTALGPAFSAYSSSATSVPDSTFTKVLYATEIFDTNNNFANSRFTPTVAGYYQINANTRYGSITSNNNAFRIYKNGDGYVQGATCGLVNGYIYMMVSSVVYLNGSTDYVEIYAFQASGTSQNTDIDTKEQFSGCLLRAA
jgi:hypothetical protein